MSAMEGATLLEKYKGSGLEATSASQVHQQVVSFKPKWDQYTATQANKALLQLLEADAPALKTKAIMHGNINILQACVDALGVQDNKPVQWVLTLLHDMLREDSSCFSIFEEALKNKIQLYKPLMDVIAKCQGETYTCDKASWLLSAVMGHLPKFFNEDDMTGFLQSAIGGTACSEIGALDVIANLFKADQFRPAVWGHQGVPSRIFACEPNSSPSPVLYKSAFAMWLLSFDAALVDDLKTLKVIKKIRDILTSNRVEKVVRMCLVVLRSLLAHKALCEEIVELNILDAVQNLEFEKWRDAELYDDVRDLASQIANEVHEMSNFDRYERELQTGCLKWGFIHTSKFWGENVMKFEQNDFRALNALAALLISPTTDAETLAVACHDVGEFVALHQLGKKKVAQLNIKEKIMELMGSSGDDLREVRREALLCCQKIMLNKWQDMEKATK